MIYYVLKLVVTAGLIVLISEVAKRSNIMGSFLASIPLVSFLAIIWLYIETKNTEKIADFSFQIFWLVLPSLLFFALFPFLLRRSVNFFLALGTSTAFMIAGYLFLMYLIKQK